jgi:hypothetical protein
MKSTQVYIGNVSIEDLSTDALRFIGNRNYKKYAELIKEVIEINKELQRRADLIK